MTEAGVRRHHGRARRRRLRRHGARERRRRSWCGWAAPSRAGVTGRVFEVEGGQARRSPTAGSTGPRSTRARAGTPPRSGAAVRDLLAAGARAGPGLRRAVAARLGPWPPAGTAGRRSPSASPAAPLCDDAGETLPALQLDDQELGVRNEDRYVVLPGTGGDDAAAGVHDESLGRIDRDPRRDGPLPRRRRLARRELRSAAATSGG